MLAVAYELSLLVVAGIAASVLAALRLSGRSAGPSEDVGAAADAGGCHRCGTMEPARSSGVWWRCPQCRVAYDEDVRITCRECGRLLNGPEHPHQASLHRSGLCPGCYPTYDCRKALVGLPAQPRLKRTSPIETV